MDKWYLRRDIKVDPTINHWHAWSQLFSPLTLAAVTSSRHLPLLESYAKHPKAHLDAAQNPNLVGGFFIELEEKFLDDIYNLIFDTKQQLAEHITLIDELKSFNKQLIFNSLEGTSLDSYYAEIPSSLKGLLELTYDLNNRVSFRLFEELLYQSEYYKPELQRVLLSAIKDDTRPFVLSTPVLPTEKHVVIKAPFESQIYDDLFKMQHIGTNKDRLLEFCSKNIPVEQQEAFLSFFTQEKPNTVKSCGEAGKIKISYLGHACILIQTENTNILIDPLLSYPIAHSPNNRLTNETLPEVIDYVIITHAHHDHFVIETLLQIRHKVKNIVLPRNNNENIADPSLSLIAKHMGFTNVITLEPLEAIRTAVGEIVGMPFLGEHGDLSITSKLAYLVKIGNKSLFFAADSNNLDTKLYERIQKKYRKIDIMFIGMECAGAPFSWLYKPFFLCNIDRKMDQSRRLNASDSTKALELLRTFSCETVYVYAMGQEPWLKYICGIEYTDETKPMVESNKFIDYCHQQNISAERLENSKQFFIETD